jgi:hypothetical protein
MRTENVTEISALLSSQLLLAAKKLLAQNELSFIFAEQSKESLDLRVYKRIRTNSCKIGGTLVQEVRRTGAAPSRVVLLHFI